MVYLSRPLLLLFGLLCLVSSIGAAERQAAVAMPERHAAETAESVLRAGGNAADASVAAAFVLAVTYPEAGNIGGGGFVTAWMDDEPSFLDFRERAPAAATRDMYLDEGGDFEQRASLVGARAAGVPGTVHGLWELHQRYGTQAWKDLLAPAIALAEEGFLVPTALAEGALETREFLDGETNFDDYLGALRAGEHFRQPELAATLRRIANDPRDFYEGRTASLLVAQMQRDGGLITAEDLAQYRSEWREPLQGNWRDLRLITAPPPSSGGIALLQLLAMRDAREDLFNGLWHNSPQYIHLLAELEKRVFADRGRYLGDPDFVDVPVAALLDAQYLQRRASAIAVDRISTPDEVPPGLEAHDTTHFSVLDGNGNAIALTYTLNWSFGNGVVVQGAGFLLNNEMDDFAAKAGVANMFGVVGSDANAIAGGKRMLSSMTPTLGLRDGEIALVVGTPGGSTIFTSVFQTLLNVYDFAMPSQQAVAATRFHHQLPDDRLLRHDQRPIPEVTRTALEAMGYTVAPNSWGNLGDVQLITVRDGVTDAAADPRGRGESRVFLLNDLPRAQTAAAGEALAESQ
jgi:gamma-glutamyltranspeptidase/glutathione hydrolase